MHYYAQANGFQNDGSVLSDIVGPKWFIRDIETDYTFGFDVGLEWIPCRGNSNVTLNWKRFYSTDSSSRQTEFQFMVGPFFDIGPDASAYKVAKGKVKYEFDAVNLDFGMFVNFGRCLQTNLYAGVGFMRLEQNLISTYETGEVPPGTIAPPAVLQDAFRQIKSPSKFTGAGPQIGLDFLYSACGCFGFEGRFESTLLAGCFDDQTDYESKSQLLLAPGFVNDFPNFQSTSVNDRTGVVPGFYGKLGVAYISNCFSCATIKLAAGWEAQTYLNAIQSVDMASQVINLNSLESTLGVYARSFKRTLSNFSLMGPYITLDVSF